LRLVLLLGFLAAGCASQELSIGKLPAVETASSGEVVVVRPSAFIADDFTFYVNVNEENIAGLRARLHTRFRLPAGEHRIAVRCTSGYTSQIHENATIQRVAAGETLYLVIEPKGNCATIEAVPEREGRRLVSNTTFIPL
jgi:hypothetical protein